MKSVAMFNNKGGVGKTTLICNLAAYLSLHRGLRVLLVDCDPQCNTTQLVMGEDFAASFYWQSQHEPITTIADVMRPINEGDSEPAANLVPIGRERHRFGCDWWQATRHSPFLKITSALPGPKFRPGTLAAIEGRTGPALYVLGPLQLMTSSCLMLAPA
jgi:hypothetical protein